MKIIIKGKLSAGYYNAMEAGYPVFIDGEPLSDIIKDQLWARGLNDNFCYLPYQDENDVDNPLIGRSVTLTFEIHEEQQEIEK